MKHIFFSALFLLVATGCTKQAEKQDVAASMPSEEAAPLFITDNIPATGCDVTAYAQGFQHVGLPTTDIQRTIDFYLGLGFQLATRHDINGRDFAFLQLGNLLIEVIPTSEPAMKNGAVDHFCLDVKNIDTLFAALQAAGYTMLDEHVNEIAFWERGAKYFFILGPNNEKIEFCEIL